MKIVANTDNQRIAGEFPSIDVFGSVIPRRNTPSPVLLVRLPD
jgi:hypothetical protein